MKAVSIYLLFGSGCMLFHRSQANGSGTSAGVEGIAPVDPTTPSLLNFSLDGYDPITFSEFPVNTPITDQYAAEKGIIFQGDNPFITNDGANPTSPVLSGTPRFNGRVGGRFVDRETLQDTVVASFTLDAGFFDELGSTRLIAYDPDGSIIGQKINTKNGIETFTVDKGNIASFLIEIFGNEPAGYAIDNFISVPMETSIIFRENDLVSRTGPWPWQYELNVPIPGFDHVALHVDGVMYEAHPGYTPGIYRGADDSTPVQNIVEISGVQSQFSRAVFRHNSMVEDTNVDRLVEVPISRELAEDMKAYIESQANAEYLPPNFPDFTGAWSNPNQKGAGGKFTCVGLIERAAEEAGYNGGQGFVPDFLETLDDWVLLSPELMLKCATVPAACDFSAYVTGILDPVDYVVTDPLGRRVGYTEATGALNEIPGAFVTPNGVLEQFFIPVIPGKYDVTLLGVNEEPVRGALSFPDGTGADTQVTEIDETLSVGESRHIESLVPIYAGAKGDLNGDGDIDEDDVELLEAEVGRFADGLFDPFDLTGDGQILQEDVDALRNLIAAQDELWSPTMSPSDDDDDDDDGPRFLCFG